MKTENCIIILKENCSNIFPILLFLLKKNYLSFIIYLSNKCRLDTDFFLSLKNIKKSYRHQTFKCICKLYDWISYI